MEDIEKKIAKAIEIMTRLQKDGTMEKFLAGTKEKRPEYCMLPDINGPDSYKKINESCLLDMMMKWEQVENLLGTMKFYNNYVRNLYEDYKSREKEITHPDILKFIADYEKDNLIQK